MAIDPIEFQRIRYRFLDLSGSISNVNTLLGATVTANSDALTNLSTSLSLSLSESAAILGAGLTALGGSIFDLSSSTSSSLSESAAALRAGLTAVGQTITNVSTSLSTSADVARELLRVSLTELIDQNEDTFNLRLDGVDGEINGIQDDVLVITGGIEEYDRKTKALSQESQDETKYQESTLGATGLAAIGSLRSSILTVRTVSDPKNYWAYTVSYPTGVNPFKINSYSYMGTNSGVKTWNLEEVVTYTKREYPIDSFIGRDANNTMLNSGTPSVTSSLNFKADQTNFLKGRTGISVPTVTITGEVNSTAGFGYDQGQLVIADESVGGGKLQLGTNTDATSSFGRMCFTNGINPLPIYIQQIAGMTNFGNGGVNIAGDLHIRLEDAKLNGTSGNRDSAFNMYSDSTYTQGSFRIIRYSPANGSNTLMQHRGTGELQFSIPDNGNIVTYMNNTARLVGDSGGHFRPYNTNTSDLGLTDKRWKQIYTNNSVSVSSDKRLKTDISSSVLGLKFINFLNPVSYKLIQGELKVSGSSYYDENLKKQIYVEHTSSIPGVRRHYGLIAQEVEETLKVLNISTSDFAGFIYDSGSDQYGLRYSEFISPIIKSIHELSAENNYLKNKLEAKEQQISDILARLAILESK